MTKNETPTIEVPAQAIDKASQQKEIVRQAHKLDGLEAEAKRIRERIQEAVEALIAFDAVNDLTEQLKAAREQLKIEIQSSREINDLIETQVEHNRDLKFEREILSGLLVQYTADHRVKTVDVDGENHLITFNAKIGKALDNQTELAL